MYNGVLSFQSSLFLCVTVIGALNTKHISLEEVGANNTTMPDCSASGQFTESVFVKRATHEKLSMGPLAFQIRRVPVTYSDITNGRPLSISTFSVATDFPRRTMRAYGICISF
jgi:hypothetical protein